MNVETHHAPELPSGMILIAPASACFLGCTLVTNGILP